MDAREELVSPSCSDGMSIRVLANWEHLVHQAVRRVLMQEDRGRSESCNHGRGSVGVRRGSFTSGQSTARLPELLVVVPQSLSGRADIEAVLEAADEIGREDSDVARILYEHAFKLTQLLDPTSEGRGVLQFKTRLKAMIKQRIPKDNVDRSQDIKRVQEYYMQYRQNNLKELEAGSTAAQNS